MSLIHSIDCQRKDLLDHFWSLCIECSLADRRQDRSTVHSLSWTRKVSSPSPHVSKDRRSVRHSKGTGKRSSKASTFHSQASRTIQFLRSTRQRCEKHLRKIGRISLVRQFNYFRSRCVWEGVTSRAQQPLCNGVSIWVFPFSIHPGTSFTKCHLMQSIE